MFFQEVRLAHNHNFHQESRIGTIDMILQKAIYNVGFSDWELEVT